MASGLEEAVSHRERQEQCTGTCVCVCVCTRVKGGAGFSVGSYCSGECNTDPWMLLTQTRCLLFYLLFVAKALPRQP